MPVHRQFLTLYLIEGLSLMKLSVYLSDRARCDSVHGVNVDILNSNYSVFSPTGHNFNPVETMLNHVHGEP